MSKRTRALLLLMSVCSASCHPGEQAQGSQDPSSMPLTVLNQDPPGGVPEVFAPNLVSKEDDEARLLVYPGGREVYFIRYSWRGGEHRGTILFMKEEGGRWTSPEPISFSSEEFEDHYISLHPNGSKLYFQSNRPVDPSESSYEWNLWYVERIGDGWGSPKSMGRPVNGRNHTSGPSVTADGTLYFTIMEMGGVQELYRSRYVDGSYQEPERLPDEVNAQRQQFDSYVAPDESYILFNAVTGPGGHGQDGGLYVAFRNPDGRWSDATRLGPLINEGTMGSATISADGSLVFFSRRDPAGATGMDLYWVSAEALPPPGR